MALGTFNLPDFHDAPTLDKIDPNASTTSTTQQQHCIPRPPNAFNLFRSAFMKSRNIPKDVGYEIYRATISHIIGMTWRTLPAKERAVWDQKAEEEYAVYRIKYGPHSRQSDLITGPGVQVLKENAGTEVITHVNVLITPIALCEDQGSSNTRNNKGSTLVLNFDEVIANGNELPSRNVDLLSLCKDNACLSDVNNPERMVDHNCEPNINASDGIGRTPNSSSDSANRGVRKNRRRSPYSPPPRFLGHDKIFLDRYLEAGVPPKPMYSFPSPASSTPSIAGNQISASNSGTANVTMNSGNSTGNTVTFVTNYIDNSWIAAAPWLSSCRCPFEIFQPVAWMLPTFPSCLPPHWPLRYYP